jgi:hypothetical protein
MPRIKSEMFEEYVKIADKVGLTKMAEDSAELKKYKDSVDARMGSDDISTIEALYGVKSEDQEYEFSIMEQAHPNSVIIAPSYDKMDGLIENNIEQHNVMVNLTLKMPTGNHTNHKYAQSDLVMELVRVANEMDARNQEELYKLADECLADIQAATDKDTLQKEALPSMEDIKNWFGRKVRNTKSVGEGAVAGAGLGAAVGGLLTAWSGVGVLAGVPAGAATGAALGGLIAAFTKTEPSVKNVEENAREVSEQLKDLYKKVPDDADFFKHIDVAISSLIQSSKEYREALNTLGQHSVNKVNSDVDTKAVADTTKRFLEDVAQVKDYHTEFTRRSKSGEFSKAEPGKGASPLYWFMQNDIEDVEDAFNSLDDAITEMHTSVKTDVGTAASSAPAPEAAATSTPAPAAEKEDDGSGWLGSVLDKVNPFK